MQLAVIPIRGFHSRRPPAWRKDAAHMKPTTKGGRMHHFFSAARMKPTTKGGRVGAADSDPHSWVSLEAAAYMA